MDQQAQSSTPTLPSDSSGVSEEASPSTCSEMAIKERSKQSMIDFNDAMDEQRIASILETQNLMPHGSNCPQSYAACVVQLLELDIVRYDSCRSEFRHNFYRDVDAPVNAIFQVVIDVLGLSDGPVEQRDRQYRLLLKACEEGRYYNAAVCLSLLTMNLDRMDHLFKLEVKRDESDLEGYRNVLLYLMKYFDATTILPINSGSAEAPPIWLWVREILSLRPELGSPHVAALAEEAFNRHPAKTYIDCVVLMTMADSDMFWTMADFMFIVLMKGSCELLDHLIDVVWENRDALGSVAADNLPTDLMFSLEVRPDVTETVMNDTSFRTKVHKVVEFGLSGKCRILTKEKHRLRQLDFLLGMSFRDFNVLKLWFSAGVVRLTEMFKLSRRLLVCDPDSLNRRERKERTSAKHIEFARYVHTVATNPRRLQDSCVQTVFAHLRHLSCKDRAAAAQVFALPSHLQDRVLFTDIIGVFMEGLTAEAPKTKRKSVWSR